MTRGIQQTGWRSYIKIEGRRLSYLEWGQSDRPTMLILHGGGFAAAADFEEFAFAFASDYHVVAPDLRGHGFSDWLTSERDYAVEGPVADLERLNEAVGLAPMVCVGHSWGGLVGLVYAAKHQDQVTGLVMEDVAPQMNWPAEMRAKYTVPAEFSPSEGWKAAVEYLTKRLAEARPDLKNRKRFEDILVQHADGRVTWRTDLLHTKPGMYKDLVDRNFWQEVKALKCPALNILADPGTHGQDNSPELQRRMIEVNPLCQAAVIKDSSHAVHFDQPEEFVRVVSRFLGVRNARGFT